VIESQSPWTLAVHAHTADVWTARDAVPPPPSKDNAAGASVYWHDGGGSGAAGDRPQASITASSSGASTPAAPRTILGLTMNLLRAFV
jgi:hypothetical protein